MKKIKILLRFLIVVLAVAIVVLAIWNKIRSRSAAVVSFDYGTVADFSLTDQTGATITRDSLKGRAWLANFIFTRCKGPCPVIAYKTSQLQNEIPKEKKLSFVSFSVDPQYDTPAVLLKYSATYGADASRWHLLTGEKKAVYEMIRHSFKLAVEEALGKEASDSDFVHSTYFVLVDKGGVIRGYYNSIDEASIEKLKKDLPQWM